MNQIKFKVVSDSMLPVIKLSDELEISLIYSELKIFDIILFKRNNELVVHLVWRNQIKYNQTVITRSMKNFYDDEIPVPLEDILGKVINFEINFFLRSKIKFLTFLSGRL